MWNLSGKPMAEIMRDEQREIDANIPRHDPSTVSLEEMEKIAAYLTHLTPRVLAMKDASELWIRRAKVKAYRASEYQDRELFAAYEDRVVWSKRTHQDLLLVTAIWVRAVKTHKVERLQVKVDGRERMDLGAVVIERAYRYRYHRTPANGAALDAALDLLAIASARWSDFRNGLE
jgi:hypothetical protein